MTSWCARQHAASLSPHLSHTHLFAHLSPEPGWVQPVLVHRVGIRAAHAAAAPAKRSWMGPIAGLAAGLGLAALASHFGFGEELANMMMFALIAFAVMAVIGYFLRKRATHQQASMAGAGAPYNAPASMYQANESSGGSNE